MAVTMKVDVDVLFDACALHVLTTADSPLTAEEVCDQARNLSTSEQLDALARYQESDPQV